MLYGDYGPYESLTAPTATKTAPKLSVSWTGEDDNSEIFRRMSLPHRNVFGRRCYDRLSFVLLLSWVERSLVLVVGVCVCIGIMYITYAFKCRHEMSLKAEESRFVFVFDKHCNFLCLNICILQYFPCYELFSSWTRSEPNESFDGVGLSPRTYLLLMKSFSVFTASLMWSEMSCIESRGGAMKAAKNGIWSWKMKLLRVKF